MRRGVTSLYMATTAPGLEGVLESEIVSKLNGAWLYRSFRGRILFGSGTNFDRISALRCPDNLYAHIAWLSVGPHKADLQELGRSIAEIDLSPSLTHLEGSGRGLKPNRARIAVSASRSGKHAFSRHEAAEVIKDALVRAHGFCPGDPERHDIAFRLDIMDDDALFSVKLTPSAFRFRGQERLFAAAALRPTVAHALVWLSAPGDDDRFLDPFCGSGSIVLERAAYRARRIIGSDASAQALGTARGNADRLEVDAGMCARPTKATPEFVLSDATALPFAEGELTHIVTNPPWGVQIGTNDDMPALYEGFLKEARRVLAPGGKAILLTDQASAVKGAAKRLGMPCTALHTVSLHGLTPTVYRIG